MSRDVARPSRSERRWRFYLPLFVLGLFVLLTLFFTRPLVGQLSSRALGGDALLNLRILMWVKSSLLGGPQALLNLPHGNILYPYRYTLLFNEHLLPTTALILPGLLLMPGPLAALNLYILLTFVLTGFGVWLLVTYWTHNWWVGLPAGAMVAFTPARMFIADQPNILTIQWIPFAILTLHRWLDKGERQDWWLALLFINLQILSATNYLAHVFLMVALFSAIYALVYRERLTWARVLGVLGLALVTALINSPAWWAYIQSSARLGIERSLGAVYLGSAHALHYLVATSDNLIYGRLVPKVAELMGPSAVTPTLFPLFPGLTALLLASIGMALLPRPWTQRQRVVIFSSLAWLVIGFLLSLGVNDHALGSRLEPYLRFLLPYQWLYDYVPGFRGFRVPARFAVLVVLALSALAAFGAIALFSRLRLDRSTVRVFLSLALVGLVATEFTSLPLGGERYPYGADVPAVYAWLASSTDSDAVLVELPYDDESYMYYASFHGHKMVNGASGFRPLSLHDEASNLLGQFPSWPSIEWLQRLGVDYVILHPSKFDERYGSGAWDQLWTQLPTYIGSIISVTQVGDDFALQLAPPVCAAQPHEIGLSFVVETGGGTQDTELQARVSFDNPTAAGFAFDPNLPSFVILERGQNGCSGGSSANCRVAFHEPLVLLPGQTEDVRVSLEELEMPLGSRVKAALANLGRTVYPEREGLHATKDIANFGVEQAQRITTDFEGGARLLGYDLSSDQVASCEVLNVLLYWQPLAQREEQDKVTLQLLDRYGWPVVESQTEPWAHQPAGAQVVSQHRLPIPGPLPAGQYTLAVRLQKPDDAPVPAQTPNGPVERLPLASIVVRPPPPNLDAEGWQPVGALVGDTAKLVAYRVDRTRLIPGDWLRLTLAWQAQGTPAQDTIVFTQLIGPDGHIWGQYDNPPRGGWYPTSLWRPGEIVADDYLWQVNPGTPPGHYKLVTGMYLPDTSARLAIQPGNDSPSTDSIVLAEIEIGNQE